jgi:hypothetical protein
MTLSQLQVPATILCAVVVAVAFSWFLWRNRRSLTRPRILRHLLFNLFLYAGVLWFIYEDRITAVIFGKAVYKGSPEELPAGLVVLGGVVFWFFIGALSLGRNRSAEFRGYLQAFEQTR